MWNGYLQFFAANTYLDSDAENRSYVQKFIAGNCYTMYSGETFAVTLLCIRVNLSNSACTICQIQEIPGLPNSNIWKSR